MNTYENPTNKYRESASHEGSWFWCLLFGPLYFIAKGNKRHAVLSAILPFVTFGISWLVYPFLVYPINETCYLRKGWVAVDD